MPDFEGPLGRHAGRRYTFGPGLVDVVLVGAVLLGGVTLLSHIIWGHVPELLFLVTAFAVAPLGLELSRWRSSRRRNRSAQS